MGDAQQAPPACQAKKKPQKRTQKDSHYQLIHKAVIIVFQELDLEELGWMRASSFLAINLRI